jgi:hypothetical protein
MGVVIGLRSPKGCSRRSSDAIGLTLGHAAEENRARRHQALVSRLLRPCRSRSRYRRGRVVLVSAGELADWRDRAFPDLSRSLVVFEWRKVRLPGVSLSRTGEVGGARPWLTLGHEALEMALDRLRRALRDSGRDGLSG